MTTTATRSAERSPVANPGQRVTINIAASLVRIEGNHGYLVDYCGAIFLAQRRDIVDMLDKHNGLIQIRTAATVVSHDGCVGYIVSVPGAELRIHEQNIVEVLL